jgi:hypothetical protein
MVPGRSSQVCGSPHGDPPLAGPKWCGTGGSPVFSRRRRLPGGSAVARLWSRGRAIGKSWCAERARNKATGRGADPGVTAYVAVEESAGPGDLEHPLHVRARTSDADLAAVGSDPVLGLNKHPPSQV